MEYYDDIRPERIFWGGANWCPQKDTYTKLEFFRITLLEPSLLIWFCNPYVIRFSTFSITIKLPRGPRLLTQTPTQQTSNQIKNVQELCILLWTLV